ncbi:MAG: CPBP family intramembrane metalloprotease [Ignavibacteria bacterium]|nr:CPBP family intramembrane metalloprotease [Ignavibacteria bacterium]MBI3766161.1 CPBP family intramembrane metalloprotease [Ignavibacteriales bacterium]
MNTLFLNPEEQRYRALWRILVQALIMVVIVALPVVGLTEAATWLLKSGSIQCSPELFDKIMDVIVGILMTLLVLSSLFVAARWLDHRKFVDFGFRLNASWWKQYFLGITVGSLLIVFIFLIEIFAGWVDITDYFHRSDAALPWWFANLYPVIKASCVGIYEEAISRGYHITNLREGLLGVRGLGEKPTWVMAIFLSSAFFGMLHIQNPNASLISTVNLVINGAMFAVAYMLTRQLAMSIGLHMAWNLCQGWVFGFPVSGDPEIATIVHIQQRGQDWITGGPFGPEGGLLGLAASLIGIGILILLRPMLDGQSSRPLSLQ